MNKKVKDLINDQINKEFFSAYLYLDMANYYDEKGLSGFAHWYEKQAREEQEHAMKFYEYLHDNGEKVKLETIDAPNTSFKSIKAPVEKALEHEKYVTALINKIYDAAVTAKDYRTQNFLDWFVNEQAEEEKNAQDLLDKVGLVGDDNQGLYELDKDLKERKD